MSLLDLCTGSGCVAVAAAKGSAKFAVTATDLSEPALEVARGNAERNGVGGRIEFLHGDLFGAVPGGATFDVILSNPPYVADGEYESVTYIACADDPGCPVRLGLGIFVHARDQPGRVHDAVRILELPGRGARSRGGGQRVSSRVADDHDGTEKYLSELVAQPGQAAAGQRDAKERVMNLLSSG